MWWSHLTLFGFLGLTLATAKDYTYPRWSPHMNFERGHGAPVPHWTVDVNIILALPSMTRNQDVIKVANDLQESPKPIFHRFKSLTWTTYLFTSKKWIRAWPTVWLSPQHLRKGMNTLIDNPAKEDSAFMDFYNQRSYFIQYAQGRLPFFVYIGNTRPDVPEYNDGIPLFLINRPFFYASELRTYLLDTFGLKGLLAIVDDDVYDEWLFHATFLQVHMGVVVRVKDFLNMPGTSATNIAKIIAQMVNNAVVTEKWVNVEGYALSTALAISLPKWEDLTVPSLQRGEVYAWNLALSPNKHLSSNYFTYFRSYYMLRYVDAIVDVIMADSSDQYAVDTHLHNCLGETKIFEGITNAQGIWFLFEAAKSCQDHLPDKTEFQHVARYVEPDFMSLHFGQGEKSTSPRVTHVYLLHDELAPSSKAEKQQLYEWHKKLMSTDGCAVVVSPMSNQTPKLEVGSHHRFKIVPHEKPMQYVKEITLTGYGCKSKLLQEWYNLGVKAKFPSEGCKSVGILFMVPAYIKSPLFMAEVHHFLENYKTVGAVLRQVMPSVTSVDTAIGVYSDSSSAQNGWCKVLDIGTLSQKDGEQFGTSLGTKAVCSNVQLASLHCSFSQRFNKIYDYRWTITFTESELKAEGELADGNYQPEFNHFAISYVTPSSVYEANKNFIHNHKLQVDLISDYVDPIAVAVDSFVERVNSDLGVELLSEDVDQKVLKGTAAKGKFALKVRELETPF